MPSRPLTVLWVLPILAVVACSGRPPEPKAPPQRWTESPNGEPLPFGPGQADCAAALGAWMARVDHNGDGLVDMDEMTADAARWFAVADQDHDGQVTADELSAVRRRLLPPEPEDDGLDKPDADRAEVGGGPGGRPRLRSHVRLDPVMQADANADFRVTASEFRTFVIDRMDGRSLTRAELLKACDAVRR